MSDDLVRRAREALVDVTPGPWAVGVNEEELATWFDVCGVPDADGWATVVSGEIDLDANARFIAAARDLVPAMADRLEAQEALLKEALAWLADFADAKFDAVQTHRASHPADEPDPVTDAETVWAYQADARATLAKLRAHLGETK